MNSLGGVGGGGSETVGEVEGANSPEMETSVVLAPGFSCSGPLTS